MMPHPAPVLDAVTTGGFLLVLAIVVPLAGVLLATALSIWYLYPSFRYYTLTHAQREALPAGEFATLRKQAVHLRLFMARSPKT